MISTEKCLILAAAEDGPTSFEEHFGDNQAMFSIARRLADEGYIMLSSDDRGTFTITLLPDGQDALEEKAKSLTAEKRAKQTKWIAVATLIATVIGLIMQAKSAILAALH